MLVKELVQANRDIGFPDMGNVCYRVKAGRKGGGHV